MLLLVLVIDNLEVEVMAYFYEHAWNHYLGERVSETFALSEAEGDEGERVPVFSARSFEVVMGWVEALGKELVRVVPLVRVVVDEVDSEIDSGVLLEIDSAEFTVFTNPVLVRIDGHWIESHAFINDMPKLFKIILSSVFLIKLHDVTDVL